MNMKMSLGLLAIVLAPGLAAAKDDFSKSTPALVEKGKPAYATNCVTCHGENMDGNGPAGAMMNPKPRDLVKGKYKKGNGPKQVFETITNGLKGTAMAGFNYIPEEDRWAIVHYIKSKK